MTIASGPAVPRRVGVLVSAAALGWVVISTAPAFAQGAPTPLFPQPSAQSEAPKGGAPSSPAATETVIGGIRVNDLGPVQPQADSVGTIDGFGPAMWQGASRASIVTYLPRTPAPIVSPTLRHLARQLLLTRAATPPAPPGAPAQSLLGLRLDRLKALGDADDVVALAGAIPNPTDETSVRARIEAALLAGDDERACAAPEGGSSFKGEFWTHAAAACDLIRGRTAQAQLALDLLGEQSAADSGFADLLRAALGERKQPIGDLAGVGPVGVALLRHAKAGVAPGALASASPLALRTVALSGAPLAVRLEAAERAESIGAISTGKLAELYMSVPFKPGELANALSATSGETSSRNRALFYRSEETQKVAAARAEAIKAAAKVAVGGEPWRTVQMARLYSKVVSAIDPVPELVWFSGDAARILYATGDYARAEQWRTLALRDPDASNRAALWPLAAIASAPVAGAVVVADVAGGAVPQAPQAKPFDAAGFNAWLATIDAPERPVKGAVVLTLLDSLGVSIPPAVWAPFLEAPSTVGRTSPLLGSMARAAEHGEVGETVLLALVSLGSGDPGKWPLETVAAVDAALERIKLGADAQALAMDAAMGAGL